MKNLHDFASAIGLTLCCFAFAACSAQESGPAAPTDRGQAPAVEAGEMVTVSLELPAMT